MSPGPDLFVVCKQCGSEVSPYITECPYCGARLRRRAPKLPRVKGRGRGRGGWRACVRSASGLTRGRPPGATLRAPDCTARLRADGGAAICDDRAGRGRLRRVGARARLLSGLDPHRGPRLGLRPVRQLLQARDRRSSARGLVEAVHQPVRLRRTGCMRSLRCWRPQYSVGCSSAATDRRSCSPCSSEGPSRGALAASAVYTEPIVSGARWRRSR